VILNTSRQRFQYRSRFKQILNDFDVDFFFCRQGQGRQKPPARRRSFPEVDPPGPGRGGCGETRGAPPPGEGESDGRRRSRTAETLGGEGTKETSQKTCSQNEAVESKSVVIFLKLFFVVLRCYFIINTVLLLVVLTVPNRNTLISQSSRTTWFALIVRFET
jgi:hypothetical protein